MKDLKDAIDKLVEKVTTLEAELVNMMDQIYRKNVPSDVRNYLDARAGKPITVSKRGRRSVCRQG